MEKKITGKKKITKSISRKVLVPMVLVVVVQVMLFVWIVFSIGTTKKLDNNSTYMFSETVSERKRNLENEMVQHWSNLGAYGEIINEIAASVGRKNKQPVGEICKDEDYSNEILYKCGETLIKILRSNGVTGSFILLETDSSKKMGLYLRDPDPKTIEGDDSDLLGEVGNEEILKKLGIPFDLSWSPKLKIEDGDKGAFYNVPFESGKIYTGIDVGDLGYWSRPFSFNGRFGNIITYTIPLLDENHIPYGVLGIEVTLDYLMSILPYSELNLDQNGGYFLGVDDNEDMCFDMIAVNGPVLRRNLGGSSELALNLEKGREEYYEVKKSMGMRKEHYAVVEYLDLYNENAPKEYQEWALIGVVEKRVLFQYSRMLRMSMALGSFLAIILGVAGVVFASIHVTRPIKELVNQLKDSNPNHKLTIEKTNIEEIDELVGAIENLSQNMAYSASRLSRIIKVTDMPIGAIDYIESSDVVYCTEKVYEFLDFSIPYNQSETIEKGKFLDEMERFQSKRVMLSGEYVKAKDGIIQYETDDVVRKWIRFIVEQKGEEYLIVVMDVTDSIVEKKKMEHERDYDVLTNILNRRALYQKVEEKFLYREFERAAFIMWDLDNLKYINDTYGHDYGDKYITAAAGVLDQLSDFGAMVSRISGDEFLVFLDGFNEKEEAREIIYTIHNQLRLTTITMPDKSVIRLRASGGIAWYPEDGSTYEELVRHADFTMYDVKNSNKGGMKEFDEAAYRRDELLFSGKEVLNRLLDDGMVRYAFQPIVSVAEGEVFGYEALMRPQSDILKTPYDVMRLAKSQSKLYQIERLTWMNALREFDEQSEVSLDTKLFLNSVPNTRLSDADFDFIESYYTDSLHRLVIEIIESEQFDKQCMAVKQSYRKKWGVGIALDDFGTGYNSEASLLQLNPQYVKIDISIISGIDKDEDRQKMLKSMLHYTKSQNILVIAEGIETKAEMEMVISLGVDYLQGYYVAMPDFKVKDISLQMKTEIQEAFTKLAHCDKLP